MRAQPGTPNCRGIPAFHALKALETVSGGAAKDDANGGALIPDDEGANIRHRHPAGVVAVYGEDGVSRRYASVPVRAA
eukprot:CAMPEP_0173444478 /NCGR_PEP_ID=MMETSP1357-20121228/32292_1 /TAXON_ID=77926 /ORGANISM="Hemiselmis rufescens, Strain PCC563" /LENGTH=77 /DNA_ID=CAMNT_0014410535 /DNA_START=193 /DNA_END=424 /DNA_ORIENTATION=+